jgi:hypothetical protein
MLKDLMIDRFAEGRGMASEIRPKLTEIEFASPCARERSRGF